MSISPVEEFVKCKRDFSYFCANYVSIFHQTRGMIPFQLFGFQKRIIGDYDSSRFNIIRKFRQGGISTVTAIYCLWRACFFNDKQSFVVSISDREAMKFHRIIRRAWENLPDFIKCETRVENQHELILETGGSVECYTPRAGRGFSTGLLVVDEAAFIPEMDDFWARVYPTVSTGGKVVVISTVNGVGNWYHQTWVGAENGTNKFNPVRLHYKEHPSYMDPKWAEETKLQLGEKKWRQEVLGEFLGSSNTFIHPDIINKAMERCSEPREKKLEDTLWIWKAPEKRKQYVIGCDSAEGLGEDSDGEFSSAQVIDVSTMEQVAEFYSRDYPPNRFAQIISDLGHLYNTATLAVENNGMGVAVLVYLYDKISYENLFYHTPVGSTGRRPKMGINTNVKTRQQIIEILQNSITNELVKIHSRRLVSELTTWVFNLNSGRVEHLKGYFDDAIWALGLALLVREDLSRNVSPYQGIMGEEEIEQVRAYSTDELITREILGEEGWGDNIIDLPPLAPEIISSSDNDILKDFGW